MSQTQLASMFLGKPHILDELKGQSKDVNNLFILDGQNDSILGHINKKYVIDNEHEQDLSTYRDTFRFTALGDKRYAQYLMGRNGLIVPGEDGELLEFRLYEVHKYRDLEGLKVDGYALATYLDLKNARIIEPHTTSSESAEWHAKQALAGMEWQVGRVDFKGVRSITFDNYTNPYDYLNRIAREFDLELRFYVTTDGQKVTGRYVDLIERVGEWRGRTVEFSRDLQGIRRIEQTDNVVTALLGVGPEREDGTRLEVFVEDKDALERWGKKGRHIVDVYEPMSERTDMTIEELEQYTRTELNKRINAVVSYEAEILDLENVPGLEDKKIRFGDTIRIKDTKFNPPLYLEARVFNQKRDVFNKANKTVQLGDYIEYTEDEVKAIWNQLRQQIQKKISAVQAGQMIEEYAEPKKVESPTPPPIEEGENPIWIDTSKEPNVAHVVVDGEWKKITPTEANEVGAETPQGAQEKADTAEQNAKSYTDIVKSDLEDGIQQAMSTADGKNTVFRQSSTPPTTNRKIGDLWFKTDEGNKMFVWTGSWTETKLDHQALSVGKLSALSADLGDITAGRIQGVDIHGGTITQTGDDNRKIILDDSGLRKIDSSGDVRIRITNRDSFGEVGFSEALIEFNPNAANWRFLVGADLSGLGDGFIGFPNPASSRTFWITNEGSGSFVGIASPRIILNGIIEGSHTLILPSTSYSFLRPNNPNNELRVANSDGQYSTVRAYTANPSSEKWKTDIKDVDFSALDLLKQSKIYSYIRDGRTEREIGFIIERETPEILKDGEGINSYSHSSLNTLAIQELIERVENIEERLGIA